VILFNAALADFSTSRVVEVDIVERVCVRAVCFLSDLLRESSFLLRLLILAPYKVFMGIVHLSCMLRCIGFSSCA